MSNRRQIKHWSAITMVNYNKFMINAKMLTTIKTFPVSTNISSLSKCFLIYEAVATWIMPSPAPRNSLPVLPAICVCLALSKEICPSGFFRRKVSVWLHQKKGVCLALTKENHSVRERKWWSVKSTNQLSRGSDDWLAACSCMPKFSRLPANFHSN